MAILAQILASILVADLLTGFIHWVEDTYGDPSYPVLGPHVFKHNIDHHKHPTLMTKMAGLIKTNWQSMSIAGFVCLSLFFFGLFHWTVLLTLILAGLGNQVHLWNHQAKSHPFVEFLKDSGLIQSQKQHNRHHIPPYDKYYCVLINFNNAWLDRINFWRKLEWLLSKAGLKVKRGSPERNGY